MLDNQPRPIRCGRSQSVGRHQLYWVRSRPVGPRTWIEPTRNCAGRGIYRYAARFRIAWSLCSWMEAEPAQPRGVKRFSDSIRQPFTPLEIVPTFFKDSVIDRTGHPVRSVHYSTGSQNHVPTFEIQNFIDSGFVEPIRSIKLVDAPGICRDLRELRLADAVFIRGRA